MLAMGRYAQWQSRFLRYIDTRPNGNALRKCILEGPYTLSTVLALLVTENSLAVPEHTTLIFYEYLLKKTVILNKLREIRICKKNLALNAKYFKKIYKPTNNNLRTSLNSRNKNVDTTLRYKNDNQSVQFRNQKKMTVAGDRENVGNMDEEIYEQELEAHYSYMAKIQEVPTANSGTDSEPLEHVLYDAGYNVFANEIQHSEQSKSIINTCVVETDDSNVIPDSPDICDNDIQNDQNAVKCDDERVALANLIANLKLDVNENKEIQKQLKKANASLTQELTECKSILAKTSRTLGESNSVIINIRISKHTK
nr:hypothetical protein [Tanacetum cinerariifolium]